MTPGDGDDLEGHDGELAEYVDEDDYAEDGDGDEAVEYVDELGRRHVRRAAPRGYRRDAGERSPRETGLPDRIEKWRRNSATGAVLTAFAFGLQQAFEPERKEPAIVMQTSGDPPKDLPVEAQLEQLGPRQKLGDRASLAPGRRGPGRAAVDRDIAEAEDEAGGK